MANYPFQRILLATEHTEFDVGAERLAFHMAKRCGIRLYAVLPLVSTAEFIVQAPELALRDDELAAEKAASLRARAAEVGVEIEIKVRHGVAADREIVEEAQATGTDLIVIRRRGKPGFLQNKLVGEMVSKVIRDAGCCVLTVPRMAEFWTRGVLASVGDTPCGPQIADLSGLIAGVCGLPLTVLSVAEQAAHRARMEEVNAQAVQRAVATWGSVEGWVREGAPAEQTIIAAQESGADLIVIGRQRYHLLPFVRGNMSIMQKIIGTMDVATLVVPGQA